MSPKTSMAEGRWDCKLALNGNFLWARAMGDGSVGYANAVDSSGNVYATGVFYFTTDFDPGDGTFNLTSKGSADIFIVKLFQNGPPAANAGPDQTRSGFIQTRNGSQQAPNPARG